MCQGGVCRSPALQQPGLRVGAGPGVGSWVAALRPCRSLRGGPAVAWDCRHAEVLPGAAQVAVGHLLCGAIVSRCRKISTLFTTTVKRCVPRVTYDKLQRALHKVASAPALKRHRRHGNHLCPYAGAKGSPGQRLRAVVAKLAWVHATPSGRGKDVQERRHPLVQKSHAPSPTFRLNA